MHGCLAAVSVGVVVFLTGCGGTQTSTTPTPSSSASAPAPAATTTTTAPGGGSGPAVAACDLVSAADLAPLGISGTGTPGSVSSSANVTVKSCRWATNPAAALTVTVERVPAAGVAAFRASFLASGESIAGVGDAAKGKFGTVLAAINFAKGDTFVSIILTGPRTASARTALTNLATHVAERL